MTSLIQAKRLSIGYTTGYLLRNINFNLKQGQSIVFYGQNGQGKSSLLRTLAGQQPSLDGTIELTDSLFFINTQPPFYDNLTVDENLAIWQQLTNSFELNLTDLKAQLRLLKVAFVPFKYLSDGQKQRLNLMLLLLSKKRLWIIDEPCQSLDDQGMELVALLFKDHLYKGGAIVFAQPTYDILFKKGPIVINLNDYKAMKSFIDEDIAL